MAGLLGLELVVIHGPGLLQIDSSGYCPVLAGSSSSFCNEIERRLPRVRMVYIKLAAARDNGGGSICCVTTSCMLPKESASKSLGIRLVIFFDIKISPMRRIVASVNVYEVASSPLLDTE